MTEIVIYALIALSLSSIWAAARFTRWHRFYGTRFLWGMRIVSYAIVFAALPVAFLSVRRLMGLPSLPQSAFIAASSLSVLIGVITWLAWRWRDLDEGMVVEEIDFPNETQNQREDRQFGTERRKLEEEHKGNDAPVRDQ